MAYLQYLQLIAQNKKSQRVSSTPRSYCSTRCRTDRWDDLDRHIEVIFVKFLDGTIKMPPPTETCVSGKRSRGKAKKGYANLVLCSAIERHIFGEGNAGHDVHCNASERIEAIREGRDFAELHTGDKYEKNCSRESSLEDGCETHERYVKEPSLSPLNTEDGKLEDRSIAWKKVFENQVEKMNLGKLKAERREKVRRAARRGCVFGFDLNNNGRSSSRGGIASELKKDKFGGGSRRKCEALQNGRVVEPSFAKGEWGVRWRDHDNH